MRHKYTPNGPLCKNKTGITTMFDYQVTCKKCLKLMKKPGNSKMNKKDKYQCKGSNRNKSVAKKMAKIPKKAKINKIPKSYEKEMEQCYEDSKKFGFGIFDQERKVRINPEALTFISDYQDKEPRKPELMKVDLVIIEKIYKEKYEHLCSNPYCLEDYYTNPAIFVERLIRAVEICTLKYVLNAGGGLNKNKNSGIVKGIRTFIWD